MIGPCVDRSIVDRLRARSRWRSCFRLSDVSFAQSDARKIVEEAQRRAESKSQRYEGLLQVLDGKGKVADKRWLFTRLGSHGRSKAVLRFVAPPRSRAWRCSS